ncbi:MAG TPA: hypothetical protein VHM02_12835, partial [Thermoanaerobaculia bacterium]|nr:hypothetical protein [Thermoanaerobaculia bacterium]
MRRDRLVDPTLRRATVALAAALAACAAAPAAPSASAPPLRMAITLDDLPVAPPERHDLAEQTAITEGLLAALAEHRVPAVGFVNEGRLEVGGAV